MSLLEHASESDESTPRADIIQGTGGNADDACIDELLAFAAANVEDSVYLYVHNNFFTMLSTAAAVVLRVNLSLILVTPHALMAQHLHYFQPLNPLAQPSPSPATPASGIEPLMHAHLETVASKLKMADTCLSHKGGSAKWHAHLFTKTTQALHSKRMSTDINFQDLFWTALPADAFDWFGLDYNQHEVV